MSSRRSWYSGHPSTWTQTAGPLWIQDVASGDSFLFVRTRELQSEYTHTFNQTSIETNGELERHSAVVFLLLWKRSSQCSCISFCMARLSCPPVCCPNHFPLHSLAATSKIWSSKSLSTEATGLFFYLIQVDNSIGVNIFLFIIRMVTNPIGRPIRSWCLIFPKIIAHSVLLNML